MSSDLKSGTMPRTDFTYEEFEGLLASFYLTLQPLRNGSGDDKHAFQGADAILHDLARRNGVQSPVDAVETPRKTAHEWGQPRKVSSCWSLLDMFRSFYSDFGVGQESGSLDQQAITELWQITAEALVRHGVVTSVERDHGKITQISGWDRSKRFLPLDSVI